MPPVKFQTTSANGLSFESHNGVYDFIITTDGSTTTIVVKKDGVQVATVALLSPTIAQLETQINTFLPTQVGNQMNSAVHVFTVNPLSIKLMSSNLDTPIPANWWVSH